MAVIPAVFSLSAFPIKRRWGGGVGGSSGGGDGWASGSDVARLAREGARGPGPRAARLNICFAGLGRGAPRWWEGGGHGGVAFPSFEEGVRPGSLQKGGPPQSMPLQELPCLGSPAQWWPRPVFLGLPSPPNLLGLRASQASLLLKPLGPPQPLGQLEPGSLLAQLLGAAACGRSADLEVSEKLGATLNISRVSPTGPAAPTRRPPRKPGA